MNKRQKKKFMDRRYEVIEGKGICVHSFRAGDIVMWTGEVSQSTETRLMCRPNGYEQFVPKRDLKRSYKKFK